MELIDKIDHPKHKKKLERKLDKAWAKVAKKVERSLKKHNTRGESFNIRAGYTLKKFLNSEEPRVQLFSSQTKGFNEFKRQFYNRISLTNQPAEYWGANSYVPHSLTATVK